MNDRLPTKTKNACFFSCTLSLTLKNGKFLRTDTQRYFKAVSIIKKYDWKKARIKIRYAWGDNYGEYTNKEDALLFVRTCREDYIYFKEEGWKTKKR